MLNGPAACRGHDGERRIGVHRVGSAHTGEQRHVEDAVAAGVAVGQVDPLVVGPLAHGAQLSGPPHEPLVEPARVTAVLGLVDGGDQVVEAEGLREGSDHVDGRGGREHEPVPLRTEGGQPLGGEGGDQLAEPGHCPPSGRLDLLLTPAPGHPGGRPHQGHGEEVLPETVVHGVEQLVPGERAPLRQHPFLHEGPVQHLARRTAQQCPVEVDENGARGHGYAA